MQREESKFQLGSQFTYVYPCVKFTVKTFSSENQFQLKPFPSFYVLDGVVLK